MALCASYAWYTTPRSSIGTFVTKDQQLSVICSVGLCVSWLIPLYWVKRGNAAHLVQIALMGIFNFASVFIPTHTALVWHESETKKSKEPEIECIIKVSDHQLFAVLMDSDIGIENFIKFQQRQFCMENILFFIEASQWLNAVTNQEWNKFDIQPLHPGNINYSSNWYEKIEKIYKKYLDDSGNYQINISYQISVAFINLRRLYQMRQEVVAGTFKPKLIRNSTVPRVPRVHQSLSVPTKRHSLTGFVKRASRSFKLAMSPINEKSENAESVNELSSHIPSTLNQSASAPTPSPRQNQIAGRQQQRGFNDDSPSATNNGEIVIVDVEYGTKTSTDSIRICIDDEEMTEDLRQYNMQRKRQSNSKQSYNSYLSTKNPRITLSLNTRISVPSVTIPPGFSPGLSSDCLTPNCLTPNTIGTITPNCTYRHIGSYLPQQQDEEKKEE